MVSIERSPSTSLRATIVATALAAAVLCGRGAPAFGQAGLVELDRLPTARVPNRAPARDPDRAPPRIVQPARNAAGDLDRAPSRDRLFDETADLRRQIAEDAEFFERQNRLVKNVYRLVEPSVVHLEARKTAASSKGGAVEEAGSGILIDRGGKIWAMTNNHVIAGADLSQIRIETSDGRAVHPTRLFVDVDSDVAVLEAPLTDVVPAAFGDSDAVEIGDFVLAVGSPFGLSRSVTFGIVSASGRRDLRLGGGDLRFQDFLQTDAAINPGNSGGPLLNLRGEVIGMNTAIASASGGSEGIGFAIPSNMALSVARQLIDFGEVRRGYLGVRLDATFSPADAIRMGMPARSGARVSGVTPDSPAAVANLQRGDVIVKFDGNHIRDDNHLMNLVSLTPIGKRVDLLVYRDGAIFDTKLELAARDRFELP